MLEERTERPLVARTIHRFSALIILAWLAITVILTIAVPPLEQVEREHAVPLSAPDAPSFKAAKRMGEAFQESDSGALAVIVLEGEQPLGDDAHRYYDDVIRQLKDDPAHVQHIQDFWGDPLTSGRRAKRRRQSRVCSNEPRRSSRPGLGERIGQSRPGYRGAHARASRGQGVCHRPCGDRRGYGRELVTEQSFWSRWSASQSSSLMLLLVFRSVITAFVILLMVGIQLQVARGIVAFLGYHEIVGLTTFVVNLLVSVGIAAGTDYGIFFFGRYQEARQAGEDRETAFFTTYRGVAKVVLASGVTIAGAIFCLSFTRLPFFQPLGLPCAVGILVAVAVALTLVPAVLAAGSRFGLFDPKRQIHTRRWRRIGTATVRWPAPILAATLALSLIGLLTLPGYKPSYNDQKSLPQDIPAN